MADMHQGGEVLDAVSHAPPPFPRVEPVAREAQQVLLPPGIADIAEDARGFLRVGGQKQQADARVRQQACAGSWRRWRSFSRTRWPPAPKPRLRAIRGPVGLRAGTVSLKAWSHLPFISALLTWRVSAKAIKNGMGALRSMRR